MSEQSRRLPGANRAGGFLLVAYGDCENSFAQLEKTGTTGQPLLQVVKDLSKGAYNKCKNCCHF
jgi:hypothetical protein